ncbi:MAG: S41 family peptidase [Clostridia bacterium]|nr:S41 family peptidase [Clostridia bacterium]
MKNRFWTKVAFILTLILATCVLAGCFVPFVPSEGTDESAEIEALIKQYLSYYYLFDYDPDEVKFDLTTGELSGLDNYTFYLSPGAYYSLMYSTDSEEPAYGIGLGLSYDGWYVANVALGSPADKAGVLAGDIIRIMNYESIYLTTPYERLYNLLYNSDTLSLSVVRNGVKINFPVFEKEQIIAHYVEYFFIDGDGKVVTNFDIDETASESDLAAYYPHYAAYSLGLIDNGAVGYIKLHQFTFTEAEAETRITHEFNAAMELFKAAYNGTGKLVLDLNYNPGGSVDYCTQVSKFFIRGDEQGELLSVYEMRNKYGESLVEDDENKVVSVYDDYFDETAEEQQIVVLTNEGSASASEMLTGCLWVYGTAIQVGTQTYGKGISQTVLPLKAYNIIVDGKIEPSYSALYFTFAYFYSPAYKNAVYSNYCNQTDMNGNGYLDKNETLRGYIPLDDNICETMQQQMIRVSHIFG